MTLPIPILSTQDLSFTAERMTTPILQHVNLEMYPGEMVGLTGPSGEGKTTLCYCLSGIIPHSLPGYMTGEVYLGTRSLSTMRLPEIARSIGLIFQDPETQLFLPRVRNELAFAMENLCAPPPTMRLRVEEVATELGIGRLLTRSPHELSGGEQQLVAIGSVMALDPQVLILDEPYAQLDGGARCRLQGAVQRWKDSGKTVLLVDHRRDHLRQADKVLSMTEGRLCPLMGWPT